MAAGLGGLAEKPDMVAIFRRSEHAGVVACEAAARGFRFGLMQVGNRGDAAAEVRGCEVVMGSCLMVEYRRLGLGPVAR